MSTPDMSGLSRVDLQFLQEVGDVLALRTVTITLLQPSPPEGLLPSVPVICKAVSECIRCMFALFHTCPTLEIVQVATIGCRKTADSLAAESPCLSRQKTGPLTEDGILSIGILENSSSEASLFLNLAELNQRPCFCTVSGMLHEYQDRAHATHQSVSEACGLCLLQTTQL